MLRIRTSMVARVIVTWPLRLMAMGRGFWPGHAGVRHRDDAGQHGAADLVLLQTHVEGTDVVFFTAHPNTGGSANKKAVQFKILVRSVVVKIGLIRFS